jgi:hypothetical protein
MPHGRAQPGGEREDGTQDVGPESQQISPKSTLWTRTNKIVDQSIDIVADESDVNDDVKRKTARVTEVDRVAEHVAVEVGVPGREADRILGDPPTDFRIIIPQAETDQAGLVIVEAAGEAERLKPGFVSRRTLPKAS